MSKAHIHSFVRTARRDTEWNCTVDGKWERVGLCSCVANSCGHVCDVYEHTHTHTECEWVTLIATKAAAATNINCPYTCSYLRLIRLWNERKKTRAHTNARTRANIQQQHTHSVATVFQSQQHTNTHAQVRAHSFVSFHSVSCTRAASFEKKKRKSV